MGSLPSLIFHTGGGIEHCKSKDAVQVELERLSGNCGLEGRIKWAATSWVLHLQGDNIGQRWKGGMRSFNAGGGLHQWAKIR